MKNLFLFFLFVSHGALYSKPPVHSKQNEEFNSGCHLKRATLIQTDKAEQTVLTFASIYFGALGLLLYPLCEDNIAPATLLTVSCACAVRAQKVSQNINRCEKKLYQRSK